MIYPFDSIKWRNLFIKGNKAYIKQMKNQIEDHKYSIKNKELVIEELEKQNALLSK